MDTNQGGWGYAEVWGVQGGWGIKGRKIWDNCNSIINKIYLQSVWCRYFPMGRAVFAMLNEDILLFSFWISYFKMKNA